MGYFLGFRCQMTKKRNPLSLLRLSVTVIIMYLPIATKINKEIITTIIQKQKEII